MWIANSNYHPGFYWEEQEKNDNFIEQDGTNIYATQVGTKPISEWFKGVSTNHNEPQIRRPIGYSLLLGLIYRVFGASGTILWASGLILQVVTGILLYLIANRLFGGVEAWISTTIWTFYPISVFSSALPYDEHLFIPLFLCGIWLILRMFKCT